MRFAFLLELGLQPGLQPGSRHKESCTLYSLGQGVPEMALERGMGDMVGIVTDIRSFVGDDVEIEMVRSEVFASVVDDVVVDNLQLVDVLGTL